MLFRSYASRLERVDANKLASAATSLHDVIFGALTSDVRVSASMDGAQEIARSMNGTLSLNVPDGRLANMDLMQEISNVGRFLSGKACFVDDLKFPDMLHAVVVRSQQPHALLGRIHVDEVKRMPGVRAVFTDRKSTRLNSSH